MRFQDRLDNQTRKHIFQRLHRRSFVTWDDITEEDVRKLRHALEGANREEDIQKFLSNNKKFLIQHLTGGHGRYVFEKFRLGTEYVADFLVAELNSMGITWHGIELESPSPNAKLSRKDGLFRHELNHAIQQIRDWRDWVKNNIAYANQESGLNLVDIDEHIKGTILMGRRQDFPEKFNANRRRIFREELIEIHTYDWLIEESEGRIRELNRR